MDIDPAWLAPTWFLDSDSTAVEDFASTAADTATEPMEVAQRLFVAVRDGFRYDPYMVAREPGAYRASAIIATDAAWCVPKSVVLTAVARRCGVPARLGFADVRNHLTSEKLREHMGTDVFAWHGYSELLLDGRWFKLSTAFNIELCERFGVRTLEFDGTGDALMHAYDRSGNRHMEYVRQHGSFDDLPLDEIFAGFAEVYPDSTLGGGDAASSRDDAFTAG